MSNPSPEAQAVSAYLNEHKLESTLESLVNQLVKSKPKDPYIWLSDQLKQFARKPRVVFVLGGPGAGKGTQCSNIVRDYGWIHLSAGDLLREARNQPNNEVGALIDTYIKEGKIVPVKITVELIKKAMELQVLHGNYDFLVDGFPRDQQNLDGWTSVMSGYCTVEFVLFFDCPESVMEKRLLKRGETSGRTDDNIESIKKRFKTYIDSTLPIINYYKTLNRVNIINSDQTVEQVYDQVCSLFDKLSPRINHNTNSNNNTNNTNGTQIHNNNNINTNNINSVTTSSNSSSAKRPQVVFVLGGPGAGKGTQCFNIVRDYGFVHLSAGDLLREARNAKDSTSELIDTYIKEGKIVPVEITVNLIKKAMEQQVLQGKYKFLVDGFPRDQQNLDGWSKVMSDYANVEFVLFFDCPESVMESRLLNRGQTSGRTDDNIESIRKRFKTYLESSYPIIKHFEGLGKVKQISSIPSAEEVYQQVQKTFNEYQW